MKVSSILILLLMAVPLVGTASAAYNITNINVTIYLNPNTSAHINETIHIQATNQSISQYQTDRIALNLTLSNWQQIIGSQLVEHIINPKGSITNFVFLPGPLIVSNGQEVASLIMSYDVNNVTTVNQTAPRTFVYTLKGNDFNFQHGASGEILSPNTTLTVFVPTGAQIKSVYPIADSPPYAFASGYKNVTSLSWQYGEPLSKFQMVFQINQSIRAEVLEFFNAVYTKLGWYTYLIVAAIMAAFVVYVYYRSSR